MSRKKLFTTAVTFDLDTPKVTHNSLSPVLVVAAFALVVMAKPVRDFCRIPALEDVLHSMRVAARTSQWLIAIVFVVAMALR